MNSIYARLPLLVVTLLLLGGTLASSAQKGKPKVKGGIWLLLVVKEDGSQGDRSVKQTMAVIVRRCNGLGIYCKLQRQVGENENRLMLRFSTRMDSDRVKRILLAEGLEVRPVVSPSFPAPLLEYSTRAEAVANASPQTDVFPFDDSGSEKYLVAERVLILTADDLRNCAALLAEEGFPQYEVACRLKPAGAARLKAWTGANINRYAAIVFNRQVVSAAYIKAPIWYDFSISGGFDKRHAQDLGIILQSGNLPAPVALLEEGTYRP